LKYIYDSDNFFEQSFGLAGEKTHSIRRGNGVEMSVEQTSDLFRCRGGRASRRSEPLSLDEAPAISSIFIKLAFDQPSEGCHRRLGLRSRSGQPDDRAGCGRQHHQAHNRTAGDFDAVFAHPNLGFEQPRGLDKAGRGACMKPALVADGRYPAGCPAR
jgi:hypothetical protein